MHRLEACVTLKPMNKTILYDGECGLCSRSVRFIKKRSLPGTFEYEPLQSAPGQTLLYEHGLDNDLSTLVYIEEGHAYIRSTATLRICLLLRFPWPILYPMVIWIPVKWRDAAYRKIANNRHRFAKSPSCELE